MPESPRWLVKSGRIDEARIILGRLRGNGNADDPAAKDELQDIINVVELERQATRLNSYWTVISGRGSGKLHLGRRTQLAIWLQFLQAWLVIGYPFCSRFARPHTFFRLSEGPASPQLQYTRRLCSPSQAMARPKLNC
jgi:Sugar (and other) transporter